jgi:rare lipoprotein A (peptidoglycan hydrolase)
MSPALAQREIALAGVALLAVVTALAIAALARGSDDTPAAPRSVPVAGESWYRALAAPYRVDRGRRRTLCGYRATSSLLGVAHPVLPCGAMLFVSYGGTQVLTEIVDRGTGVPGREFDVTTALARRLGLHGTQPIEWRFAERPRS